MAITSVSGRSALLLTVWCLTASGLLAQTAVKLPKNRYTPQQDVELGREAAAEIRQQYPIIKDERIASYLDTARRSAGRGRAGRASSNRSTNTRSRR